MVLQVFDWNDEPENWNARIASNGCSGKIVRTTVGPISGAGKELQLAVTGIFRSRKWVQPAVEAPSGAGKMEVNQVAAPKSHRDDSMIAIWVVRLAKHLYSPASMDWKQLLDDGAELPSISKYVLMDEDAIARREARLTKADFESLLAKVFVPAIDEFLAEVNKKGRDCAMHKAPSSGFTRALCKF